MDAKVNNLTVSRPEGVGMSVKRREDRRLLDGKGEYLADLNIPGTLDVHFLRSPVAHARLLGIDVPESRKGAVFTAADFDWIKPIVAFGAAAGFQKSDYHALAKDKVRFVGDIIAMCVAPTRAEAEDIAQECLVDFDELQPIADMADAQKPGAPLIHEHWDKNVYVETKIETGDIAAVRASAPIRVEKKLRMGRHAGISMETRGVLAYYDQRMDELVVYSSTQFPHVIRTILAQSLGLAESKLRVVAPDVGGGFGIKNNFNPEELAIAALAMKLRKPVRWLEDRREHLIASPHAREHRYDLVAYADRRGKVLGIEATVMVDAGAYSVWPWTASMEAGMACGIMTGPYDVPVYHGKAISICTNKSPLGPYRGVGRTGACFAIETLIDAVARAVDRNPEEVRIENMVKPSDMPYKTATHKLYDSGDYPECARRAIEAIDFAAARRRQQAGEADGRFIGVGSASYTEQSAHGTAEWVARGLPVVFGFEPALARFTPDGQLVLYVGIQNHGQGLETTLAQVAHQELGIAVENVTVRHGDSSVSPYGMGTFASRSMTMSGGAVSLACSQLADKMRAIAAHMMKVPVEAITLQGGAAISGTQSVPFSAIAEAAYLHPERLPEGMDPALEVSAVYQPSRSSGAFSYATHACVVAVDVGTGLVEVLDYVVCHDCGTMVNPMIVEAQVVGGVAQGLGTALYEEIPYDENGQPMASTFLDYIIPGPTEVPDVRVLHMETPSPHTRFGIKGMGEGGAIAPPAVVINAVNDALRHMGVEIGETPLTPDRLLTAIAAAQGVKGAAL
ncbi:MAG: xanthine dehydrogenase family protein molybdopterin-binding subunit [Herminiimonas sp.]|nr:xanthine dehydrogenase family protein molybdopterin-binding subunit [Herminiimonas sp.]MDB5854288.1 xanthine dehydrogenase family protein molybdopterin-binding subunit [Herminiimonas sp.]